MGLDDANDDPDDPGACVAHMWIPVNIQPVTRAGVELPDGTPLVGMSIVNECRLCGAIFYEPSGIDRLPKRRLKRPTVD